MEVFIGVTIYQGGRGNLKETEYKYLVFIIQINLTL